MSIADRYIGLVLLFIGGIAVYVAMTMEHPTFNNDPGPTLMLNVVGVLLIICSFGLLLFPKTKKDDSEEEKDKSSDQVFTRKRTLTMFMLFLAFIAYVFLLDILGFIVATLLFLMISAWLISVERTRTFYFVTPIYSVVTCFAIYYVFQDILAVSLPSGVLF
ncbi:tripartite tricarboxylate transporter TctB family protein [Natribacillus halophilus]|uniref:Tripartite tricarboxylate transporter TctB family protein n=1 Tax=Natribacillus halophilus TaxID=549003 RepID=A0A1G8RD03_9BACI|nr:tripartite tricarboxylate transporter TctB family protein [Natribacillus halophilus]SDJ14743.1 Tripartite tricarboxylate transporter TctB family protein [Natribacillus halophilus]